MVQPRHHQTQLVLVLVFVTTLQYLITFSHAALTLNNNNFFELPHIRREGFQDIKFSGSRVGTTELLVLTKSNGNPPPDQIRNQAKTSGGGWDKVAYGGNDDKAAEIWLRRVTNDNRNDLGRIDSSNGKGALAIIVFEENLSVTATAGDIIKTNSPCELDVSGSGDFFFVFGSDNGGSSSNADIQIDTGGDDPSFYYVTTNGGFRDRKLDSKRGGIAGIRLSANGGAAPNPTPNPTPRPTPRPTRRPTRSNSAKSISVVAAQDSEENNLGDVLTTSRDLEFGHDVSHGDSNQLVCMRFTGVGVSPGASVSSAIISFTGRPDASVGESPLLTCYGDRTSTSASLADADFNLSTRTPTRAQVKWTPGFWPDDVRDERTNSANLASIVEEIVSRDNWRENNALTVCCKKQDGDTSTTKRRAYSTNGAPSEGDKPELVVTFVDQFGGSDGGNLQGEQEENANQESLEETSPAVAIVASGAGLFAVGGTIMFIRKSRQSQTQNQLEVSLAY